MAVTSNTYTVGGSGQAGPYSYSFPILADADVKVSVNGVVKTVTTHYTLDSSNTRITFTSGNHPSTGDKVIVYRDTDEDPIKSVFASGSTLRSNELNDNFNQLLYIVQENDNQSMSTLGGVMQGNLGLGLQNNLYFEGATDDAYETTVTVVDPTADRTITLPNETGTVVTTGSSGVVTSTMITDATIVAGDIANATITGAKLVNDTIEADQIAANAIGSSELAAGSVIAAKIGADAVDGTKLADNAVNSEHYTDGSIDLVHLSADSVDGTKIVDNAIDSEHYAADSIDTEHYAPGSVDATALGTNAVTEVKINANAVTAAKIASGAVEEAKIANTAVTSDKLGTQAVTTTKIQNSAVTRGKIAADAINEGLIEDDAVRAEHIQANAVGTSELADAELVTLAGMQSGTASILAGSTALTSTLTELNLLDGKSIVTSVSGSSTDVQLPTAKAVNDQIVALMQASGGFYPIDDELKFPNANPDPNDDAGTIVSIADAGGIVVNGSGVSTTGRTLGGATVTINGIDSSLHNSTIAAGKGMLVQTTSTLNTYTYHRLIVDEAGVANAQTLVNDFNDRYQIASSAPTQHPDGSALQDGDLWFDTSANVMKVYDLGNTSYNAVTSVGDYKLLTPVPDGATSGTPNYANTSIDLRDGSNAANITSVGQLLVSVNGVLQRPNSGTYSSSNEGFHLEGTNGIKFCTAPGTGANVFVTLIGSATSVNVPATNSIVEAAIQSNVVSEEKLKISNGGTNGQFLSKQSGNSGGLTWATVDTEGTGIKSTGESGGTKYLREDGDGTCSWQSVPAGVGGANGVDFNDTVKARWGTGNDLEIYHDSHSYIDSNTSHLYIRNNVDDDDGGNIYIQAKSGENSIVINDDEGVNLYFDSNHKAGTTSTGFQVVGVCAATSYTGDGSALTGVASATADGCIYENDQTISNNYTIASGKGAHSVGPITVNATVTVNGNWVVS